MSFYEDLIRPNVVHADFGLGANGGSTTYVSIAVTYKDGTTASSDVIGGTYGASGVRYETPLELIVSEEKEIKTITVYAAGYDVDSGGSYGNLHGIKLERRNLETETE